MQSKRVTVHLKYSKYYFWEQLPPFGSSFYAVCCTFKMAMGNVFLPYILEMSKAYSKKGELKDSILIIYHSIRGT